MTTRETPSRLLGLLVDANAREVQVSVQYMIQHGVGAGHLAAPHGREQPGKMSKFVASHSMVWLPGVTLKKIAITEMQHAEAIVERIVLLGGVPTERVDPITIGETERQMLEIDMGKELEAIALYREIIQVATAEGDEVTARLFQGILSDEEKHHQVFSGLLGAS